MRSVVFIVLCVLLAVPAAAQTSHVVSQPLLDAAVQEHVSSVDQDRETVRQFLQRDDVKAVAGKAGIDIGRAETAVAALDASELAALAAQARHAEGQLAGGQSVTISATWIIIGLLVLILIIVAT
jgi:hypothetical protein